MSDEIKFLLEKIADLERRVSRAEKMEFATINSLETAQVSFYDNMLQIKDNSDPTRILQFSLNAAQPTGSTIVMSFTSVSGTLTTNSAPQTLTNKRKQPRVNNITSSATITPDVSAYDQYSVTALAANVTIAAPTGTPTSGEWLIIRTKDDGTPRTITWNAIYRGIGLTLPANTVAGKVMYAFAIYNATETKWDVWKIAQE